jgi:hypothetical protein
MCGISRSLSNAHLFAAALFTNGRIAKCDRGFASLAALSSTLVREPMAFSSGNWNLRVDHDEDALNCGGQAGVKMTAQYPLPQSPKITKNHITLLTGARSSERGWLYALRGQW